MTCLSIAVRQLAHGEGLPLPSYASEGASGMDLRAALPEDAPFRLSVGARALIPTGLSLEIPQGFEGQVRPRSGLALRSGVTCLNTPGTIDWDYRGELKVLLINLGQDEVVITRGERIAQIVFAPVTQAQLTLAHELTNTERGAGGFGSTGAD